MEVFSAVVFDETLHFLTLPDGKTDEGWGVAGIEGLLDKYLDDDAELAKHFFRRVDQLYPGGYDMTVKIRGANLYDIRLSQGGETEIYPNRFVFFES
ncbi:hypothetical protein [Pseudaminobacter soli (ex Li et al. 2025)]|uniref:Uncharacterized protein n=1 Tax=Pseudaminobacter soli (ex Li et al. 2025) TaxID=1295366 RepID=A0A2P7SC13_9HYPH|nr:hypothetical protein [Mesorhizobium soli]PSJ59881.1 hypothetical protein C7I85_16230 [Mesorhizobium soli]